MRKSCLVTEEIIMAEQHHELAHVFTDPSQTVNDARGAAARVLNTPYTFPNYTKPEWTEKLRY